MFKTKSSAPYHAPDAPTPKCTNLRQVHWAIFSISLPINKLTPKNNAGIMCNNSRLFFPQEIEFTEEYINIALWKIRTAYDIDWQISF